MRQIWLITGGAILAFGLMVGGFALNQANQEEIELSSRMQSRTQVLADSLAESVGPSYLANSTTTLHSIINRFVSNERLAGLVVFDNAGAAVAQSENLPPEVISNSDIEAVMDSDEPDGVYIRSAGENLYVHTIPLHDDERVIGALTVVQNATYIDEGIRQVWFNNGSRLLLQIILFAGTVLLLVRFVIFKPLARMTESLRSLRAGTAPAVEEVSGLLWAPLTNEIRKMNASLRQARNTASEEARMRLEKLDTPWTAERLKEFIKAYLKERKIFIVSQTEPYIHTKAKNGIRYYMPASGLVTALESVMEACGGLWIAHGKGDADRETVDADGKIRVPPDEPKYTLKRLWLTDDELKKYYAGFANSALWPLCHTVHVRPAFHHDEWLEYVKVNEKFARALLKEIEHTERPVILIQDFHFTLLPRLIKKHRPDAQIGIFWHIPWPSAESFSICPWRKEILEGMLGADIIGFHTQQFCNNFIETVNKEVESLTDFEHFAIARAGHTSYIKPFPIGTAFTNGTTDVTPPDRSIFEKYGIATKYVGIGVDRTDYIKGLIERCRAVEFLLDEHPEYVGQFTFLQIMPPVSKSTDIKARYGEEVKREIARVNEKFETGGWKPIVLANTLHTHEQLLPLYRAADVCIVTSVHDGMNLVSKEFVAARGDEGGTLVLSQFTGASRDLKGALIVNPYSAEETSEAIHMALAMPREEQRTRMQSMRNSVKNYNVYRWAAEFIKAVASLG